MVAMVTLVSMQHAELCVQLGAILQLDSAGSFDLDQLLSQVSLSLCPSPGHTLPLRNRWAGLWRNVRALGCIVTH